jgi:flavorubredoxin
MNTNISNDIKYIGVYDYDITLFEGQYPIKNGMAYNSYVIFDEKIAVTDTVDKIAVGRWLENLDRGLGSKKVDYLIVQHLEPDHSAGIDALCEKFPEMKVICSAGALKMLPNFCDVSLDRVTGVKENDTLCLGAHTLTFVMAPMVHWPEVMVTYDSRDRVLFSADGFGKFGTVDADEAWEDEARRYYINIVGKYGKQVQALLKKASALEIKTVCPLHGPVLTDTIGEVLRLYDLWSSYTPEKSGVLIACASIHGNTLKAAHELKAMLEKKGETTVLFDLTRGDISECVSLCFCYDRIVLMASSYDAGVFAPMSDLLHHLQSKAFQNRTVALCENSSWAPSALRTMKAELEKCGSITLLDKTVSIKTRLSDTSLSELRELANELSK